MMSTIVPRPIASAIPAPPRFRPPSCSACCPAAPARGRGPAWRRPRCSAKGRVELGPVLSQRFCFPKIGMFDEMEGSIVMMKVFYHLFSIKNGCFFCTLAGHMSLVCQATSATIAAAGWLQRPRVAAPRGR